MALVSAVLSDGVGLGSASMFDLGAQADRNRRAKTTRNGTRGFMGR